MSEKVPWLAGEKWPPRADPKQDGTKTAVGLRGVARRKFWKDFETVGQLLFQQTWTFAKTMADNPHWYSRRSHWEVEPAFAWVVKELRARGYRQRWKRTYYTQLDVNDHFYWTMGYQVNWPNGHPLTQIINRKPTLTLEQYDVARVVDPDPGPEVLSELYGHIGVAPDQRILEIDCGHGLSLPYVEVASSYIGIEASAQATRALASELGLTLDPALASISGAWPEQHLTVMCTRLQSFVPPFGEKYDRVIALFGAGNRLTREELERIPLLLAGAESTGWIMFNTDWPYVDPHAAFSEARVEDDFMLGRYRVCQIHPWA